MTPSRLIAWLRDPTISEVDYPISTTRGYAEVVAVYLAFFAAGVLRAVLALVGVKRTPAGLSWATAVPNMITTLATAALTVTVVVVLSGRRHRSAADLGLAPRHNKSPVIPHMSAFNAWVSTLALASIGFFAFAVGAGVLGGGGYDFGVRNLPNLCYQIAGSVNAGVVEETVVLAFVVVTLAQAKRPAWEIVAAAVLLRGLFHLYYGPGALAVVVWIPVSLIVFWWGRSLFPVIVAHILWDVRGDLGWYGKTPPAPRARTK
jgi:hypothetical protein